MLNAKNVERDSNFELLRIVAMLMIIGHHLALYGAPCDDPSYISPNILLCQFIQGGGKLGDNIFILITGYFSITTDKVNYLKIYRLWKQMVFFPLLPLSNDDRTIWICHWLCNFAFVCSLSEQTPAEPFFPGVRSLSYQLFSGLRPASLTWVCLGRRVQQYHLVCVHLFHGRIVQIVWQQVLQKCKAVWPARTFLAFSHRFCCTYNRFGQYPLSSALV